jgi:limonene-1,2-epoxide hydrolase
MSTTLVFDPDASWLPLEDRIQREQDPRRRALLEQVRNHMRSEIQGHFDELMETLTAEPQYHLWGIGEETGPKGREGVAAYYRNMFAGGGNRFHFDIRRIVVDEDCVVTEGAMIQRVAGAVVAASGVEQVEGETVDTSAEYLAEWQILTVWPSDGKGRLLGEDIYTGSPPMARLRRLAP